MTTNETSSGRAGVVEQATLYLPPSLTILAPPFFPFPQNGFTNVPTFFFPTLTPPTLGFWPYFECLALLAALRPRGSSSEVSMLVLPPAASLAPARPRGSSGLGAPRPCLYSFTTGWTGAAAHARRASCRRFSATFNHSVFARVFSRRTVPSFFLRLDLVGGGGGGAVGRQCTEERAGGVDN